MKATAELPNDPALPGLAAIRAEGLARALPELGLDGCADELSLCGYSAGSRATFEVRVGQGHFAVKAFADDPAPEAALYEALAAARRANGTNVHAPPLLAWNRDLRLLAIGWLEGPTMNELRKSGQGQRAGELAALWIRHAASLTVNLGPPFGAARMLARTRKWAADLGTTDRDIGADAATLAETLACTLPPEGTPRLVHGSLHARHVLDLGDGPGLIDWRHFGQGPAELDAAMFLANLWRSTVRHEEDSEAARAADAFLAGIGDFLDPRALAWHRAAALLRLAHKKMTAGHAEWPALAKALLAEAARLAGPAG
ncbi:MAG TPA: phosphotransferase [Verrucomicrobiae bacterium]|jgi:hypothetical protein